MLVVTVTNVGLFCVVLGLLTSQLYIVVRLTSQPKYTVL